MSYHYVGKLSDANVFLPYVARVPVLFVEPHQSAYPKARIWAAFAFSPGVVGILVGVYIGIATADVGNLLSSMAVFAFFGQLLFGVPAALTGGMAVWAIGCVVTNDVAVTTGYAAIGLGVALVVALWVLPKSKIKNKR